MTRSRRLVPRAGDARLEVDGRTVKLTNPDKPFWPDITKGDLLQYYVDVAPVPPAAPASTAPW